MAIIACAVESRKSVLGIVQAYCASHTLSVPVSLNTTSSPAHRQLKELVQEVGDFCVSRGLWSFCRRTSQWLSTGLENQGAFSTLAPDHPHKIIPGTFWNASRERRVRGPISDSEWTLRKQTATQLDPIYRIDLGSVMIWPVQPAGESLSFEYRSRHWLVDRTTCASRAYIEDENDQVLLPRDLVLLGLDFYWRRVKELPYAVEESRFLDALTNYQSSDSSSTALSMDNEPRDARPGIIVPQGNWRIP